MGLLDDLVDIIQMTPDEVVIATRANELLAELAGRGWGPNMVIETIANMLVMMYAHPDCPVEVRQSLRSAVANVHGQFTEDVMGTQLCNVTTVAKA